VQCTAPVTGSVTELVVLTSMGIILD
jgi:hypothetical protein